MNKEMVKKALEDFDFNVIDYGGMLQIVEEERREHTKITREQVHAALQYKIDKRSIRQIDPWTIIITF